MQIPRVLTVYLILSLVFIRPAQDPVAKLVIDPEVDEEVGEVVDVEGEEEVAVHWEIEETDHHNWDERRKCDEKQRSSYFDRFHVTPVL